MPEYKAVLSSVVTTGPGPYSVQALTTALGGYWNASDPKTPTRVRQALENIPGCARVEAGIYVYLPLYRTEASMMQPVWTQEQAQKQQMVHSQLIWLPELQVLLNPHRTDMATCTFETESGLTFKAIIEPRGRGIDTPIAFGEWVQQEIDRGASAIEFLCLDGKRGRFRIKGTELDRDRRQASDRALRDAAVTILQPVRRGLFLFEVVSRLLASGVYHREVAPSPMALVLFAPEEDFVAQSSGISYRPGLHEFRARLAENEQRIGEAQFEVWSGGFALPRQPIPKAPAQFDGSVQITASLRYGRSSRTIQIDCRESLNQLHQAILAAFEWFDDEHLWLIYPDPVRRTLAFGPEELEEAFAAAPVTVGELVGDSLEEFVYIFDLGAEHEFRCRVTARIAGVRTARPTVVSKRGNAPPQYPSVEEDWLDDDFD